MPIVISLTGRLDLGERRLSRSERRDWLARVAVWFESVGDAVLDTRLMRDSDERPVLLVDLHPVCPPVEVRVRGSGKVHATAATTPAGPGYHQYLCDLFHQLAADFEFEWDTEHCADPTDFFFGGRAAAVEQQFLRWIAGACARSRTSVGLPAGHGFTFPGEFLTPLGPRTKTWAASVVEEPHRGGEFFAWWNPNLDSAFYRNRALARLWCEFSWRRPLTDAEGEAADQIANDLATAFKLDPAAELPWAAWLELLDAIQADSQHEQFCVTPPEPVLVAELQQRTPSRPTSQIGYRRYPVRVPLDGGWSVLVPGSFAREWDDDRNWTGWDSTRTVWFRRVGFTKPNGSVPTASEALEVGRRSLPEGESAPTLEAGQVRGVAVFGPVDEEGRTVWRLSGVAGTTGQLAVCNVYSESRDHREWAIEVWQSLRHSNGT